MTGKSKIEWTEHSWNPLVGCSIVSPGCTNCYAMKQAHRMLDKPGSHYEGTTKEVNGSAVWTGKLAMAPEKTLLAPIRRQKPTTYFVNSMGDLFHEDMPLHWIYLVLAVMALTYDVAETDENHVVKSFKQRHIYQVLTKRADRMKEVMHELHEMAHSDNPYTSNHQFSWASQAISQRKGDPAWMNAPFSTWQWVRNGCPGLWLGVSAEDQPRGDLRIPDLLDTPAAVRFVSIEPCLSAIDLTRLCLVAQKPGSVRAGIHLDALANRFVESGLSYAERGLDWIIVGGESGPGARPMHPDWARALRDQCQEAGVAFHFKQWGEWAPTGLLAAKGEGRHVLNDGGTLPPSDYAAGKAEDKSPLRMTRVGKRAAGRRLGGRTWDEMPEVRS